MTAEVLVDDSHFETFEVTISRVETVRSKHARILRDDLLYHLGLELLSDKFVDGPRLDERNDEPLRLLSVASSQSSRVDLSVVGGGSAALTTDRSRRRLARVTCGLAHASSSIHVAVVHALLLSDEYLRLVAMRSIGAHLRVS